MLAQPQVGYAFGFHWAPSMMQLHLHVLSRDYEGVHMKRPNHWRSFCSPFFRPLDLIEQELQERGQVAVDFAEIDRLTRSPLQCPRCGAVQPSLPVAKQHLRACNVAFAA